MELFKKKIAARCAEKGITEYEIYYQLGESTCVGIYQQAVNQFTASTDGGVCLRCVVNGKLGYASTEDLNPEGAAALVDRAADNATVLECEDPVILGQGGQTYTALERKPCDLPDTPTLIRTALDTQQAVYAVDDRVVDGTATQCLSERNRLGIWNSKGLDLSYGNQIAGLVVAAVVSDGTESANEAKIRLGALDTIDAQTLAAETVSGALEKLGGQVAPTGVYPVVFSPKAMAELLKTFSSVFSAEAAQKGLSALADQVGQSVAAECVTILDDPFHPDSPMPIPFDAEGSPTRPKAVVESGVLATLLHNLKTAAKAGVATTGNAAKAGYKSPIGVRPFSMYIAGGDLTAEELLARAGEGVYIDALQGTHAGTDPVSGDFSIQSTGYRIENGKKTTRIKGFTVAGNFYQLLRNITAVANDSHLASPLGMTAYGAPTTLVETLSIAGK